MGEREEVVGTAAEMLVNKRGRLLLPALAEAELDSQIAEYIEASDRFALEHGALAEEFPPV